ncbi:MAG: MarC family protein [Chlorobi bacterium]|nr:MarC family protein [Chlorobiota bacterium]
MQFDFLQIFSSFMVLFAVIDITGSIPIIIALKDKGGKIEAFKASLVAFLIMSVFLFVGEPLLNLFGVDIASFAIAGAVILFLLGLEMVLGVELFKNDNPEGASIVPIAFPLVAGAGSITSLLSLKAEYHEINIFIALFLNLLFVYFVLKATRFFERFLGKSGILILKKMFGIILIAIAIKLFMSNTGIVISKAG